ncbi:hypothetical protein AURDEDRAFT_155366 [Auricularia subglabra TFB-10046 SS5]|nr:hypothetical protein AURDEDRAFT_155366 [Auricularia subglabra TFB-10046 SS5]
MARFAELPLELVCNVLTFAALDNVEQHGAWVATLLQISRLIYKTVQSILVHTIVAPNFAKLSMASARPHLFASTRNLLIDPEDDSVVPAMASDAALAALKTRMSTVRRSRSPSASEAESSDGLPDNVDAPKGMPVSASRTFRRRYEYPGITPSELEAMSAPRKARRATIAFRTRDAQPSEPASDADEFQLADPTAPSSVDIERVRMSERARMRHDIFTSEDDLTVELAAPVAPVRSLVVEQLEHAAERELIRRDIFTSEGVVPRMAVRATANLRIPQYSRSYGYLDARLA